LFYARGSLAVTIGRTTPLRREKSGVKNTFEKALVSVSYSLIARPGKIVDVQSMKKPASMAAG